MCKSKGHMGQKKKEEENYYGFFGYVTHVL